MKAEMVTNPYPGLRPFEVEENHLFFGRESQIEELLLKLERNHFVGVVGTSGSGKSSLVRAGLLPMLYGGFMSKAGSHWRIAIFRPGKDPIRNMAAALVEPEKFEDDWEREEKDEQSDKADEDRVQISVTETILRRSAVGLLDYAGGDGLAAQENLLIVVDQFEELFRFKEKSESKHPGDEASAFVKLLLEATHDKSGRVYVVITMRSDFLGDCSQFRNLPEAINDGQYPIPRLTRDQLRQAIEAPAKVQDAYMTPRLVNRLLNDIGDDQDQLPILQHALMRTWDKWIAEGQQDKPIDLQQYEAIGGMAEALSLHADEAYAELKDDGRKKIAEKIFKCLTETDPDNRETRRATTLGEICEVAKAEMGQAISVIDIFRRVGRTFLMPPPDVPLDKESLIDISHESLIRNWKLLKQWVEEEANSARQYRRIADAAELKGRNESTFWEDPQLAFAIKWRDDNNPNKAWGKRHYPDFDFDAAMRFLDESSANQKQEQASEERRRKEELERERRLREQAESLAEAKQREAKNAEALAAQQERLAVSEREKAEALAKSARKLRWLIAALLLMTLLTSASAIYAWVARRGAIKNAEEAGRQTELAKTSEAEANRQAGIARQSNEQKTQALKKLEEAKGALETKNIALQQTNDELLREKSKTQSASDRDSLNRSGLVSFERGEDEAAIKAFSELKDNYENAKGLDEAVRNQGKWWALHNLGAMHWKSEDISDARKSRARQSYEDALNTLDELDVARSARTNNPQIRNDIDRSKIATLRKLAQFYHDCARKTNVDQDRGYFNAQSRDLYYKLLNTLDGNDQVKYDRRTEANVRVELADAHFDLEEDKVAKKVYGQAVEIYKKDGLARNSSEIIATLKKLSEIV